MQYIIWLATPKPQVLAILQKSAENPKLLVAHREEVKLAFPKARKTAAVTVYSLSEVAFIEDEQGDTRVQAP